MLVVLLLMYTLMVVSYALVDIVVLGVKHTTGNKVSIVAIIEADGAIIVWMGVWLFVVELLLVFHWIT